MYVWEVNLCVDLHVQGNVDMANWSSDQGSYLNIHPGSSIRSEPTRQLPDAISRGPGGCKTA